MHTINAKVKKPYAKFHQDPAYDYHEVENWIEKKTGRKLNDWSGKHTADRSLDIPYQNFWHWLIDEQDVKNRSFFDIECDPETSACFAKTSHAWIKEILDLINEEFPEAEGRLNCYVSW